MSYHRIQKIERLEWRHPEPGRSMQVRVKKWVIYDANFRYETSEHDTFEAAKEQLDRELRMLPTPKNVFMQADGTWWCVWSGYTLGPYVSEEVALDAYEKIRAKMDCPNGSCDT